MLIFLKLGYAQKKTQPPSKSVKLQHRNITDLVRIPFLPKLLLFVEFKRVHFCRIKKEENPTKLVVERNKL